MRAPFSSVPFGASVGVRLPSWNLVAVGALSPLTAHASAFSHPCKYPRAYSRLGPSRFRVGVKLERESRFARRRYSASATCPPTPR
jgi:hypothetical protein